MKVFVKVANPNPNSVLVEGSVTQSPILMTSVSGLPMASFTIQAGAKGHYRVLTWTRTAENCAQYLKLGQLVRIKGRVDSVHDYITNVVAQRVEFLPGPILDEEGMSMKARKLRYGATQEE